MDTELYKDRSYNDTILLVKGILSDLNLEVSEYLWEHTKGYFTTMVRVEKLDISTIGKGRSKEQSFASAYGEFMERLQNMAFFKFQESCCEEEFVENDYYFAPDEELIDDFCNPIAYIFKNVFSEKSKEVWKLWLSLHTEYERKNKSFLALPFYKLKTTEKVFFPALLLNEVYGTNGMAAGNSLEEAMLQGISEILERYANKKIYTEKIVPPIIPQKVLEAVPEIMDILKVLEKHYLVEVRDCSLGEGLPVVGLWIYNKKYGKYYIKFGSHPVLKVAVERCVTELFQGRGEDDEAWLRGVSFDDISCNKANLYSAYKTGNADYPYQIFGDKYTYEYINTFIQSDITDNKKLFEYLEMIVKKNGKEIFYRDVSFLRFPACQIIIPGMSEVFEMNRKYLEKKLMRFQIKNIMRKISKADNENLESIAQWIGDNSLNKEKISSMANLKFGKNNIYDTNCKVFEFFIWLRLGELEKAYQAIDEYIKNKNGYFVERFLIFRCFKDYLEATIKEIPIKEIQDTLKKLYPSTLVYYVQELINEPKKYFKKFAQINCPNCKNCLESVNCYIRNRTIFRKEIMKKYLEYLDM